jgi:hypothetical protein
MERKREDIGDHGSGDAKGSDESRISSSTKEIETLENLAKYLAEFVKESTKDKVETRKLMQSIESSLSKIASSVSAIQKQTEKKKSHELPGTMLPPPLPHPRLK